jgi:hypothetical protein
MEKKSLRFVSGCLPICFFITFLIFVAAPPPVQALITSISVESINLERLPVVGSSPVIQKYNLIKVENAVGTVILFAGGNGKVGIGDGQLSIGVANFLVQSRFYFAAEGFHVVVIDPASDFWTTSTNGLNGWRTSIAHLSDISDVINDLPKKLGDTGPIILIGTSRGTISVGAYAAEGPSDSIDCIVLTSSLTQPWSSELSINLLDDVDLESINVPVYLVAHKDDLCFVTPPSDIKVLKSRLKVGTPKVKTKIFKGGTTTLTDECSPLSAHGYFGIEPKVVRNIGKWIRKTIGE